MVKLHRCLLSTYFYFDLIKSPYGCYNIHLELGNKFSKVNLFLNSFGCVICHLLVGVYCKRNTTFTSTIQLYKSLTLTVLFILPYK